MKFTLRDIERIRAVAEKACKSAYRLRNSKFRNQAVNWADFGVVEVTQTVTVLIEEADPGADDVRRYIREKLDDAGYSPEVVDIYLEW